MESSASEVITGSVAPDTCIPANPEVLPSAELSIPNSKSSPVEDLNSTTAATTELPSGSDTQTSTAEPSTAPTPVASSAVVSTPSTAEAAKENEATSSCDETSKDSQGNALVSESVVPTVKTSGAAASSSRKSSKSSAGKTQPSGTRKAFNGSAKATVVSGVVSAAPKEEALKKSGVGRQRSNNAQQNPRRLASATAPRTAVGRPVEGATLSSLRAQLEYYQSLAEHWRKAAKSFEVEAAASQTLSISSLRVKEIFEAAEKDASDIPQPINAALSAATPSGTAVRGNRSPRRAERSFTKMDARGSKRGDSLTQAVEVKQNAANAVASIKPRSASDIGGTSTVNRALQRTKAELPVSAEPVAPGFAAAKQARKADVKKLRRQQQAGGELLPSEGRVVGRRSQPGVGQISNVTGHGPSGTRRGRPESSKSLGSFPMAVKPTGVRATPQIGANQGLGVTNVVGNLFMGAFGRGEASPTSQRRQKHKDALQAVKSPSSSSDHPVCTKVRDLARQSSTVEGLKRIRDLAVQHKLDHETKLIDCRLEKMIQEKQSA